MLGPPVGYNLSTAYLTSICLTGTDLSGSIEVIVYCTVLSRSSYSESGADPAIKRTVWPPADVHVDHSKSPGRVVEFSSAKLQIGESALLML